MNFDCIVTGGGIVGLATAWRLLQKYPGIKLAVLEKETGVAKHQTGRNSGVIHSGIYYKPGSAKARLCREGYTQLVDFAREHGIAHDLCGKVIVALEESELPRLQTLADKAIANGLQRVTKLDPQGLREIEPHAAGLAALRVPETGIIDYVAVCEKLAQLIAGKGGKVLFGEKVEALGGTPGAGSGPSDQAGLPAGAMRTVVTSKSRYLTRYFVNCGGQYSDRLARLDGLAPDIRIAPFRGEYYAFKSSAPALVKHLIYPVPDPEFPFLGVHFTRMIGGGVECGPNAVLAMGREAYGRFSVNLGEALETLTYSGFHVLARKHWRMGLGEFHRSFSKAAFVKALQRLLPAVTGDMLEPRPAGIRAQALRADGSLVDDFAFAQGASSLHVLNAPSPAATASLAIGSEIASRIEIN
jgi:(S)-2-hydroxyglutarate dehydrogenase